MCDDNEKKRRQKFPPQVQGEIFLYFCFNWVNGERQQSFQFMHGEKSAAIFKSKWLAEFTSQKWCRITKSKDVAGKYSISIIWMTETDDSIDVYTVRKYLFSDWLSWEMKIPNISCWLTRLGIIVCKKRRHLSISSTEEVTFVWSLKLIWKSNFALWSKKFSMNLCNAQQFWISSDDV